MNKILVILIFLLTNVSCFLYSEDTLQRQMYSYKYDFAVGDTLVYTVMSSDSITINWGAPLLRIRLEKMMLTCDSITPAGHYLIKQQLIDFNSKESYLEEKNVVRNSSTWLNVAAYIEIDSLGRRYKTYNSNNNEMMMAPGGPFQPFILFPLDNSGAVANSKYEKESWMVEDSLLFLPENGIPNPALRTTFFYRMIGIVDTLDLGELLKMTFSVTSQGIVQVSDNNIEISTSSVSNAGGEIFWDIEHRIPKYYIHTVEQRLTIANHTNNTKEPGFHYIHSTYILDKFIRQKK